MDFEDDNPFGPVCDCFMCNNSRATTPFAPKWRPAKKKRSKKSHSSKPACCLVPCRSAFTLYWKPQIPCDICHRTVCHHRFLDSSCCRDCVFHAKLK